jgi:16S rRNA (guanine966-N2)-methyltransferase
MNNHSVRIIGGKWRGRKITFPDASGLRPTPDRVKETLFNWLMHDILDSRCLDLFAGSGSLGLEAYSRGAKEVVLIEQQPTVFVALQKTLVGIGLEKSVALIHANALVWLKQTPLAPFDVVFLDPPFQEGLLMPALTALSDHRWVRPGGLVYAEFAAGTDMSGLQASWKIIKHKKIGKVECALLKLQDSATRSVD